MSKVKKDVPLHTNTQGVVIGTTFAHAALHLRRLGFRTTIHTTDIDLLDRTWEGLDAKELRKKLTQRKKFIRHPFLDEEAVEAYAEGYVSFVRAEGRIKHPVLTTKYLHRLLEKAPFIAAVSKQYLVSCSKKRFVGKTGKAVFDDVRGQTNTHAIVVAGYRDGRFLIIDSSAPNARAGRRWLNAEHLIGAICLAETEWDNLVITAV
ncbi:MAG: hypothetical protein Q8Q11_02715 [bacterium]|nr:hypothetical protein [bacterium]